VLAGLGVLAGDTVRSAADLQIPMVAVSLVTKKGYFKQRLTPDGMQIEEPASWDPSMYMEEVPAQVKVMIENREVKVKAWYYPVISQRGRVLSSSLIRMWRVMPNQIRR
jgi:starch phosphorylase